MEARAYTRRYSSFQRTAVDFLWRPYIPIGKVTVIQGDPGSGKTTFALSVAAFLSTGRPFPETDGDSVTGESIYQSAEDDPNDTITPRLMALGADCDKVSGISVPFNDIDTDCEVLENAIREVGAKLAVIDPWQAYIGKGNDMNRASDVRRLMSGLAVLAAKTGCAIVCIAHMSKTQGTKNLYRSLGSIDFAASARSVLQIALSDEDKNIRVMSHIKSSLAREGQPLAFVIGDGSEIEFLGVYGGEDALPDGGGTGVEETKRELAKELIVQMLTGGARLSKEVFDACKAAGVGSRTVNTAKSELSVKSVKIAKEWYWEL